MDEKLIVDAFGREGLADAILAILRIERDKRFETWIQRRGGDNVLKDIAASYEARGADHALRNVISIFEELKQKSIGG